MSSAGDINGDGFDDIIVGASDNDTGGTDAGAAYVVYGKATPIMSVDLDTIATGIGGFKITGENAGDLAGLSVFSAGDINGDGYDDLVVGAEYNNAGGADAGAAYVVYGKATSITSINLDNIALGNGGFKIVGERADDSAGRRVSSVGDINGDGYDDIIVGAHGNDAGGTNAGAAYVVYGKATPFTSVNLDDIALGNGGFRIMGENAADGAGFSVSSAGDINGDGYDDIIVGANGNDAGGTEAGAAYVVYGKATPITSVNLDDIALGNGGFRITGENAADNAGRDVSSAGDINGDGYHDILVTANRNDAGGSYAGAAYVVYGKAAPINSVNLDDIALGNGGFKIVGEAASDGAGISVSSAGDVNGDGFDDILVGANGNDTGGANAGAAYLVYGGVGLIGNTSAHISGGATGAVTEDGVLVASGQLSATYGNATTAGFAASTSAGTYGSFTVNASGQWTYTLNNTAITVQALNTGESRTESFTVRTADSSAISTVTVTINGAADVPYGVDDAVRVAPQYWSVYAANGHAYTISEATNFASAMTSAAQLVPGESYMGNITSAGENAFVYAMMRGYYVYLGATDSAVEGTWVWTGGPEAGKTFSIGGTSYNGAYVNWQPGEPNNSGNEDYVKMVGPADTGAGAGTWYDLVHTQWGPTGYLIAYLGEAGAPGLLYDDIVAGAPTVFSASILLANDLAGSVFAGVQGVSDMGAAVSYNAATGNITYDPSGSAAIAAIQAGVVVKDTFTYILANGSTADVTIDVIGTGSAMRAMSSIEAAESRETAVVDGNDDDTLLVTSDRPGLVDGGDGFDTLTLDGSGIVLDFSQIESGTITNVEAIDLTGTGDNGLAISLGDILDVSSDIMDGVTTLAITGDSGDQVTLVGAGWQSLGSETHEGIDYSVFGNSTAHLIVEDQVTVSMAA